MKRILLSVCVALLALSAAAREEDSQESRRAESASVIRFINGLKAENAAYCLAHKIEFFSALAKGQEPIATIVTCTDSRVQTNMFDSNPEGRLLIVRNMGNQLATAEGSVEYGIHQLHTPVLMFIGHSRCGVIADVSGNYSQDSAAVKRELDSITIPKDLPNIEGVKTNVHNQVAAAMVKFAEELKEGKLTVIGAVLDLADDLHQGAGKLSIINVNGETDPAKLGSPESLISKPKVTKHKKKAAH
jgi:carbonic anhydrase